MISLKVKEWLEEGNNLRNLMRYEEALVTYQQAIDLDPNNVNAYYGKAYTLRGIKRFSDARPTLKELSPSYAANHESAS